MKKFKKLIPAFCAMLVSAAMLGTSTYAWFSVNKEVTATGMNVTAVADTQYFLISTTADFSGKKLSTELTTEQMTQKGINDEAKVYPAAYGTVDTLITEKSWYTANVDTVGTNIVKATKIEAPAGEGKKVYQNNQYFVGYSFYVGLAENSADYNDTLKVLAVNSDKGAKIAAVQFQAMTGSTATGAGEFLPVEDTTETSTTGGLASKNKYELSATATSKKCVKITVYVFIYGGADNIKNGSTELTGKVGIKVGASTEALA